MSEELTKDTVIDMATFISAKITELTLDNRKEIYRIIIADNVDDEKVHSKGGGIQIKYKDLPWETIAKIHKYIKTKIEEKTALLQNLNDSN